MKALNQVLSPNLEKYHHDNITELESELRKKIESGDCILL